MTMHEGHRGRVRDRFRREGLENFAPHEVLELLLYYTRARGDTNPLAHRLLDTFGSLKGVLETPVEQLCQVPGVGEETATLLSMMVPLFRRYEMCLCEEKKRLKSYRDSEEYCRALLTGLRKERFYVISVSVQMQVLGCRVVSEGSITEVVTYPRLVLEAALNHNAYGVILCHNHPGGEAVPSPGDQEVTLELERALSMVDIVLLDHLIVADGGIYSMARHGDFVSTALERSKMNRLREEDAWSDEWA